MVPCTWHTVCEAFCMKLSVWSFLYEAFCTKLYEAFCMKFSVWISLWSFLYEAFCMNLSMKFSVWSFSEWSFLYEAFCLNLSMKFSVRSFLYEAVQDEQWEYAIHYLLCYIRDGGYMVNENTYFWLWKMFCSSLIQCYIPRNPAEYNNFQETLQNMIISKKPCRICLIPRNHAEYDNAKKPCGTW